MELPAFMFTTHLRCRKPLDVVDESHRIGIRSLPLIRTIASPQASMKVSGLGETLRSAAFLLRLILAHHGEESKWLVKTNSADDVLQRNIAEPNRN